MARLAVADGTRILACTPHILPGLYDNDAAGIARRVQELQAFLKQESIHLQLVVGADVHIAADLLQKLQAKTIPTLNGSRYFLLEPPHHIVPPNLIGFIEQLIASGYIPIITHPERLTWVNNHYDLIARAGREGALMQITAGALTGRFGSKAKALSHRMLEEGRIDFVASDGHNISSRPPSMKEAFAFVSDKVGSDLARNMFVETPARILQDADVLIAGKQVEPPASAPAAQRDGVMNKLRRAFKGSRP